MITFKLLVSFIFFMMLNKLANIYVHIHNILTMFLNQTNGAAPDVKSIAKKSKNVQKALEEIQKREDQLKKLHDKEHQGKESGAQKRKEEMEQKIKDKILSANR